MSDRRSKNDLLRFNEARTYEQVHELVVRMLEDPQSPEQAELSALLADDIVAQDLYVEYIQDTAALRSYTFSDVADTTRAPIGLDTNRKASHATERHAAWWAYTWVALAATVAMIVGSSLFGVGGWLSHEGHGGEIATIVRVTDVTWSGEHGRGFKPLSRVSAGQALALDSGQLEIVFDTGVELLVTGPAAMSIESPLVVVASSGTYTARVGERGKGFTIDTPASSVTDLGTEFGVSIESDEKTDVVVFDGAVDITLAQRTGEPDSVSQIRLTQGEALAVSRRGGTKRIVTMYPGQYPTVAGRPGAGGLGGSLFEKVTDNLSDSGSKKFYRIVPRGFGEDARAFVDRRHEWNGIDHAGLPEFLVGGDYVMPFNDNKFLDGLEVSIRLRSACNLYILFDRNMTIPGWLREGFTDTGHGVGLDHGVGPFTKKSATQVGPGNGIDDQFSVWVRRMDGAEDVVLGGAEMPPEKDLGWNMYGVVAVPLPDAENVP